jgi:peptidoglycan/LPS O-acetylase OafA/YrhL
MIGKNYNALDVAKFVCAEMILCAHFASTWGQFPPLLDDAFSLYVIGVPFFFACSGFLLFEKLGSLGAAEKSQALWKYGLHILRMYLAWSAIYFVFVGIGWIQEPVSAAIVLAYFHRALVFTTYATIWFLPALLAGVLIVYWLSRWLSFRAILYLALTCYLAGSLGYSYSFLLAGRPALETAFRLHDQVFITTRNGLFNGFPFVALGAWMASRGKRMSATTSGLLAAFSLALLAGEAFGLKLGFGVSGVDTAISLVPFTFFFMEFLLALEFKDRKIYSRLREMSTLIFLSQRIFISALPSVLPAAWVAAAFRNSYLALAATLGATALLSWSGIKLSERHGFLKALR